MGGASCRFWSSLLCVFVSFCLYIITDQMGGASGGFWCSLLCANEQAPRWICNVAEQPHLWMECKGRRTKKVRLEKLTRKTQIQKERETKKVRSHRKTQIRIQKERNHDHPLHPQGRCGRAGRGYQRPGGCQVFILATFFISVTFFVDGHFFICGRFFIGYFFLLVSRFSIGHFLSVSILFCHFFIAVRFYLPFFYLASGLDSTTPCLSGTTPSICRTR